MSLKIDVPEGIPGKPEFIEICMCGHPVSDHYAGEGCQAARSFRSESVGGGIGTSRCECPTPDVLCTIPRKYVTRFRQSPVKAHALLSALASMNKVGALDEIEWREEKLFCHASPSGAGCAEGNLKPYYSDRQATKTVFMCALHGALFNRSGDVFNNVPSHLTKKQREERIAKHLQYLGDEAYRNEYRRRRGLLDMRHPKTDIEEMRRKAQRDLESERGE